MATEALFFDHDGPFFMKNFHRTVSRHVNATPQESEKQSAGEIAEETHTILVRQCVGAYIATSALKSIFAWEINAYPAHSPGPESLLLSNTR